MDDELQTRPEAEGRIGAREWFAALLGLGAVLAGAACILGVAYWLMVR
jgi:hypothetical protein